MAQRSNAAAAVSASPLFSGLGCAEVERFARACRWAVFGRGDAIVRQGQPADSAFLLESGHADVVTALPGGGPGIGSLPSAAIGAVSSLLIGELAKELHLTGFAGGLVTTIGTSITTQLITNAYGVATGATYISTLPAFHGQDGTRDPTNLLAPDGDHPNAAGHAAIAALLPALPPPPPR